MQERFIKFVNEISAKNHIFQLVKNLDLCLTIETEEYRFYLYFKDNKVILREQNDLSSGYQAKLAGENQFMIELLDGGIKLRNGINSGYFRMDCPYRIQLALESIFFLSRPLTA
ncbi:hypothetical protein M3204_03000 [Mesobacillus subterraneus]|uniref:hypothetical protein n=1 Tax=Mesobacillus subterraneus TaxID=285983 RepID=UPI0020417502|nr:hypothetical protein [Mesobacillus subterraneus]MCM3663357.1 hypothetical protein [Mesobacillus subterraneus]MCM3683129.1 hypothetical protein [Mesobacillus subterraneus]